MKLVSNLVVFPLLAKSVFGGSLHISSADGFVVFSNNVNSGTSYSGTTVYLDTDIDFNGKSLDVIGNTNYKYFKGTFDGQGHIISNLKIKSNSQYVGLFGNSTGLTIKNVVVDDTCSFESSYSSGNAYLGGILGYCYATSSNCNIESIVNMGNVTFSGSAGDPYFGGITGCLKSSSYKSFVKNCANYGTVTLSGTGGYSPFTGGIVGLSEGLSSSKLVNIQNCLNYGAITQSVTTLWWLYIGGIVGYSYYYTKIENCVSGGLITVNSESNSYTGSIVGCADSYGSDSYIGHCFWTSDVGYNGACGYVHENYPNIDVTSKVTLDSTVMNKLNTYSSTNGWNSWAMLHMNGARLNDIKQDYLVVNNKYFPDAVGEGYTFDGWFKDSEFNEEYNPNSIDTLVDVYAKITRYAFIVTFDFNNRTKTKVQCAPNENVACPENTDREGYTFGGWFTDSAFISPFDNSAITKDITLYAKYNAINFTISFNTTGGTLVDAITSPFNSVVSLPTNTEKDDYAFLYWVNENGEEVSSYFTVTARNVTLTAVWLCTHIASVDDFIDFANNVNSGTSSYFGYTVYLDTDLDFSGKSLGVIGKDIFNIFQGTLDGQGHVISNLKIKSNSQYVGLFGYSKGLTIKNVVIDDTCSVMSSYSSSSDNIHAYIGGILGYCNSWYGDCNIESIVNMGNVTFSGSINYLYFGGIAGYLKSSDSYTSTVKNCANYGTITHTGTGGEYSYIGGIVGYSYGYSSSELAYIHNCLNYGAITCKAQDSSRLGGIVGYARYTKIENCVSGGLVTKDSNSESYTGYIFGASDNGLYYNSFRISDVGCTINCVTINSTILKKLNTYSSTNGWSSWAMLHMNGAKINNISQKYLVVNNKYFPDAVGEGYTFNEWFKDSEFNDEYDPKSNDALVDVYAKITPYNFTITFGFNIGTTMNTTYPYGDSVIFPSSPTKGCISSWVDENGKEVSSDFTVPARNVTLTAVWVYTLIASVDDFIDFANNVNSGVTKYSGTTVYLDVDINFNGKSLDVIGKDTSNYFQGTFDGQGHIINNLKINSNSWSVGLFGYSERLTIKNVVVDDTCFVESSYINSGNAYLGGILGYCESTSSNCNIENIVNMGNVTFSESANYLYFGGITGFLKSSFYKSIAKNCANYGTVTHSGTVSKNSYFSGIVGFSYGYSSNYIYIQNCLNYGAITGKAQDSFRLGGIVGYAGYTKIENCVSGGLITGNINLDSYDGSIVGNTDSDSYITNCFWTSDTGYFNSYGNGSPTIDGLNSQVVINSYVFNKLNAYSSTYKMSNWTLLHLNGGRINNINQEYLITNNKYFPDPEKEGLGFAGWYKDPEFNVKYNPKNNETLNDVYAKYSLFYTVVFDFNNGTKTEVACANNSKVVCPENTDREGFMFIGWFSDSACRTPFDNSVIVGDITLYAKYEEKQVIISSSSSSNYMHSYGGEGSNIFSFSTGIIPLSLIISILFSF